MKRLFSLFLMFAVLFGAVSAVLTSCGAKIPQQVLITQESAVRAAGDVRIAAAIYDTLVLSEDDKKHFPELDKAFEAYNLDLEAYVEKVLDAMEPAAQTLPAEQLPLSAAIYSDALRLNGELLSLLETREFYLGNGGYEKQISTVNFSVKTGALLSLDDVLVTPTALADLVIVALAEKETMPNFYETWRESAKRCLSERGTVLWTLNGRALTVYFPAGCLAPEDEGIVEVDLFYLDHPNMVKGEYQ